MTTAEHHNLWHFHGGLRLPANKSQSTQQKIRQAEVPKRLVFPLQQHIGDAAEATVKIGDYVYKGQRIAKASGYVSVPIHASSSGTVVDISEQPVPHPSGLTAPCIVIETDQKDQWLADLPTHTGYRDLAPSRLRTLIRDAGIVGLGGAGFPSFIKLNPTPHDITTLVLNAAECEPYISCDDMLMREHAIEVIEGAQIMAFALSAAKIIIGIEDNKPEAYKALVQALDQSPALDHPVNIVQIPSIYPTGGEKQLIKVLTGKEVPSHGLPIDLGLVCHNVGTATAVYQAVVHGQPLISRVVTVTGEGIQTPGNLWVRLGTSVQDLVRQCGHYSKSMKRLVVGGPMMGFSMRSDDFPITKTSNCILCSSESETPNAHSAMPCIRCGDCVQVCPALLLPQQLYWYARAKDFDKAQDYHLFDCIECGCCAYVCPSRIPLVQYYRFAKTEIWASEREKQKSDIARQRYEFRLDRLEREKAERAERLRKKKAALNTGKDQADAANDPKKAAIQAALDRVRAKQAQQPVTPKNIDNLTTEQQKKIADVEQRRNQQKPDTTPTE